MLKMAVELAEDEEGYVLLLQKWQERFPKPDKGWDEDRYGAVRK